MVITGFWLDILMIIIFSVMILLGLHTGFVKKIYDLFSLFVVLFISMYLYKPFASFLMFIMTKESPEMVSIVVQMTTSLFYQCFSFLIIFVVLMILRKLIGIVIRPLIKKVVDFFTLIKGIDRLLGMILNAFIALLINASLIFILPMFEQTQSVVDDSQLAPYVLEIAPDVFSEGVSFLQQLDLAKQYENLALNDEKTFKTFIDLMIQGSKLGVVDEDIVEQFILENEKNMEHFGKIELSEEDYQQFQSIIYQSSLPQETKDSILKRFYVKEG